MVFSYYGNNQIASQPANPAAAALQQQPQQAPQYAQAPQQLQMQLAQNPALTANQYPSSIPPGNYSNAPQTTYNNKSQLGTLPTLQSGGAGQPGYRPYQQQQYPQSSPQSQNPALTALGGNQYPSSIPPGNYSNAPQTTYGNQPPIGGNQYPQNIPPGNYSNAPQTTYGNQPPISLSGLNNLQPVSPGPLTTQWSNPLPSNTNYNANNQWYPGQSQSGYGMPQSGISPQIPQAPAPQQSVAQQGLSGNNQQTFNFIQALRGVGAGNNNTFLAGAQPQQQQVAPMIGAPTQQNNGSAGQVSYNYGLGNQGATNSFGSLSPQVGASFQPNGSSGAGGIQYGGGSAGGSGQTWNATDPTFYSPGLAGGGSQYGIASPPANGNSINPATYLMSDENEKEKIKPNDYQNQSFMDHIKAYTYQYKNTDNGVGKFSGPMAQDLEKSEIGKQAVINMPDGSKRVDTGRLALINTGALATLNERIDQMEKQFKLAGK